MHHGSRLVSTEKFGHKRILSVGLQLTAFSDITNGPDVSVVAMRIGSPREVPAGQFRPIASRKLGTTRTHRQSPRLVGTSLLPSRISHLAQTVRTLRHRSPPSPLVDWSPTIPSRNSLIRQYLPITLGTQPPHALYKYISQRSANVHHRGRNRGTSGTLGPRCQSRGSYSMTHRMESTPPMYPHTTLPLLNYSHRPRVLHILYNKYSPSRLLLVSVLRYLFFLESV